ncbi:putative reverse transcriptase domain-containing protein [Tanacetum coccineum]
MTRLVLSSLQVQDDRVLVQQVQLRVSARCEIPLGVSGEDVFSLLKAMTRASIAPEVSLVLPLIVLRILLVASNLVSTALTSIVRTLVLVYPFCPHPKEVTLYFRVHPWLLGFSLACGYEVEISSHWALCPAAFNMCHCDQLPLLQPNLVAMRAVMLIECSIPLLLSTLFLGGARTVTGGFRSDCGASHARVLIFYKWDNGNVRCLGDYASNSVVPVRMRLRFSLWVGSFLQYCLEEDVNGDEARVVAYEKEPESSIGVKNKKEAFTAMKQNLCVAPILALPEGSDDFVVYCDASIKGLGAVLMQRMKVIALRF